MTTFETIKSPSSVVPYSIDWSATLNAFSPQDTISTSSWTADNGVTIDSNSKTIKIASVVVSAGNIYNYANLTNTITTAAGHTYIRTVVLSLQTR